MFRPRHRRVIRRSGKRPFGFVRSWFGPSWIVVSDAEADARAHALLKGLGFTDPPDPPPAPILQCFVDVARRADAQRYVVAFGDWIDANDAAMRALRDQHPDIWRNIIEYSRALYTEFIADQRSV